MQALMASGRDGHGWNKQRLSVDLIVERDAFQQAERGGADVGRGQHGLVRIPTSAVVVHVISGDGRLTGSQSRCEQGQRKKRKDGAGEGIPGTKWHGFKSSGPVRMRLRYSRALGKRAQKLDELTI